MIFLKIYRLWGVLIVISLRGSLEEFVAAVYTGVIALLNAILEDVHPAFSAIPFAAKGAFCS